MINPEEKKVLTEQDNEDIMDMLHQFSLMSIPGGKLVLEIEQRFLYLDKHYYSKKLGLNLPIKKW